MLLAGGASSRLGKPKQLLPFRGSTLLDHAIGIAKNAGASNLVVVLGADAENILESIKDGPLPIVLNNEWQEGMASSIRKGVEELLSQDSSLEGVLIMACDQPHLSSEHLVSLVEHAAISNKLIAASKYGESLGIPAFFRKELLTNLCALQGDSGAKKLMLENKEQVAAVEFPAGDIDIDTEADYQMLLHKIEG